MKKTDKNSSEKNNGRVYTPHYIVGAILDLANYCGTDILGKHAIDNSCGEGAFLVEMAKRYCVAALESGLGPDIIRVQLAQYLHGVEIDEEACEKCRLNLEMVSSAFGVSNVEWDIRCADTLEMHDYDGKMDFVLGNPPYIRVHNAKEQLATIKSFSFAQNGMTDLYLVFYEIGIRMLGESGVLAYITPSSFFNSLAGKRLRDTIIRDNLLAKVVDMKHFQPFKTTTYTTMVVLQKNRCIDTTNYYGFDGEKGAVCYIDSLKTCDFCINGKFYFSDGKSLSLLRSVISNVEHCEANVKNGYATLCDEVFVRSFEHKSPYVIPVVKASTGKTESIIFPYGDDEKIVSEEALKTDKEVYSHLLSNRNRLSRRSTGKTKITAWYAYGRSQAIKDTGKDKLSVNSLVRRENDLKLSDAPAGTGVYGGLYILVNGMDPNEIKRALSSKEFITYVSALGKYKSGGYYTFSSKELKAYLDYKFAHNGGLAEE